MQSLLDKIQQDHVWEAAPTNAEIIREQFERNNDVSLPDDMKAFYRLFKKASLFDDMYRIMPIERICTAGEALFGPEWADSGPPKWFAFCEMQDGDYVAIDLTEQSSESRPILDLDHRDTLETNVIAVTFSQFLQRALNSRGQPYYLGVGHGWKKLRTEYQEPPHILNARLKPWYESLGSETGPERCHDPACSRLHIRGSIFCRKHHFEEIKHFTCPFED